MPTVTSLSKVVTGISYFIYKEGSVVNLLYFSIPVKLYWLEIVFDTFSVIVYKCKLDL